MSINSLPDNTAGPSLLHTSLNQDTGKEIRSLTGLRGVAALYVAVYHWFRSNIQTIDQLPYPLQTFIKHGYLSVDMFFILSGFVITLSSKKHFDKGVNGANYLVFMKRRFARVYPVYFIITGIAFAVLFHFGHFKSLLLNLFLVQTLTPAQYILGPSWSLSAEWFAYLIFPLFFSVAYYREKPIWSAVCLAFSFLILVSVSYWFNPFLNGIQSIKESYGPLDRYRGPAAVIRCFAEYLAGVTLFKLCAWYKDKYSKYYPMASVMSAVLIFGLLIVTNSDVLIVFLLVVLIGSLYRDKGAIAAILSSKYCYFLGLISYSLYLIHPIVIDLQMQLQHKLSGRLIYMDKPLYLIFFLLLIYFSYLTHQFIEVPSRNYVKRLLKV